MRVGGDDADAAGEVVDQPLEALQARLVVDAEDGVHDAAKGLIRWVWAEVRRGSPRCQLSISLRVISTISSP